MILSIQGLASKIHGLEVTNARKFQEENITLQFPKTIEACVSHTCSSRYILKEIHKQLYLPVRIALCSVPFLNLIQTK